MIVPQLAEIAYQTVVSNILVEYYDIILKSALCISFMMCCRNPVKNSSCDYCLQLMARASRHCFSPDMSSFHSHSHVLQVFESSDVICIDSSTANSRVKASAAWYRP